MVAEKPAKPRKWRKLRWVVGICLVSFAGHCVHQNYVFFQAQAQANALLEPLEGYQASHGHYPASLEELPSFTALSAASRERITYTTYEGNREFFLSAIQPFSKEMRTYASEGGQWQYHHLRQLPTILEAATSKH